MKLRTIPLFLSGIVLLAVLEFGNFARSQEPTVHSSGANMGWTYYGFLNKAGASGTGEQWTDISFSVLQSANPSKIPSQGMQLRCNQIVNLRGGTLTVNSDGSYDWPAIVGLLASGTTVKIVDVKKQSSAQGERYWVQIESH